jgi:hypothetical protein
LICQVSKLRYSADRCLSHRPRPPTTVLMEVDDPAAVLLVRPGEDVKASSYQHHQN